MWESFHWLQTSVFFIINTSSHHYHSRTRSQWKMEPPIMVIHAAQCYTVQVHQLCSIWKGLFSEHVWIGLISKALSHSVLPPMPVSQVLREYVSVNRLRYKDVNDVSTSRTTVVNCLHKGSLDFLSAELSQCHYMCITDLRNVCSYCRKLECECAVFRLFKMFKKRFSPALNFHARQYSMRE